MVAKLVLDQLEKTGGALTALTLPVANATTNQVLKNDGAGALSWSTPAAAGNAVKIAYLVDEKADTTAGGTFTSGSWQHRDLQTEYYDTIGMTFGTNTFIFPDAVGTYYIDWSCPAMTVVGHQSRLYNITDAAVVKYGTSSRSMLNAAYNDAWTVSLSYGSALVSLSATATFKIEHRCSTTRATYGLGDNVDFGGVELYTTVKILQIA